MNSKNEALKKKKGGKCSGSCPSCCIKIQDKKEYLPRKEEEVLESEEKEVRRDKKE